MQKNVILRDGREVLVRELNPDDVDRSLAFFSALPDEDRAYLRRDVTKRTTVVQRLLDMESGRVVRLAAVVDDEIVADGALELDPESWKGHMAEIRLIVARPYQRQGLGMLMARELYFQAASRKVEEVVVKFMAPQGGARSIFERLGFKEDAVLRNYAHDMSGRRQDLVVMRCDLEALWQKLEAQTDHRDWRRTR
jgi:ribosomal protein S18 acetylase RimI-like enzyme